MWSPQPRLFSVTILQAGGLCLAFVQPESSKAACESAESCLDHKEPRDSPWYIWFCMSLFLVTILLCVALCCLQRWLTRCRRPSSQRAVAVFALSDVHLVYENDVAPGMLPRAHPHLQSLERDSSYSRSNMAGDGSPPPYEEIVKHKTTTLASPSRDTAPGEQPSRRGLSEESPPS